jgi:hypothetical protein
MSTEAKLVDLKLWAMSEKYVMGKTVALKIGRLIKYHKRLEQIRKDELISHFDMGYNRALRDMK